MNSKTYTHPLVNKHICAIPPGHIYTHGQKSFVIKMINTGKLKCILTYYKHNYYIVSIHWRNLNIKSIKYFWMVGVYICTVDICLRRSFPDTSKMSIQPVAISSIMKEILPMSNPSTET